MQDRNLLQKTLSLSENGGIYYAGARVKTSDDEAVLFVGLGGSGADALIRIKNEVTNRTVLPIDDDGALVSDVPNGIGFLGIDTDITTKDLSYGSAHFDEFGSEFCDISVNSLPDVIDNIKKQKKLGMECWQWFSDDVNSIAGKKGAGGIRQIGRLLLAYNIENVERDIRGKIRQLTTGNNIDTLTVFMFSGISGGTGAGTFLDMSYILRKIAKSVVPNVNVLGYLIMTDVNELNGGEVDTLRANGFACLKELDYWMASSEHQERYTQIFPHGFVLNELEKPFDFCHLMDASDIQGHQFSYDKILRSIAEHSFVYMAGESGGGDGGNTAMTQMYDNIHTYLTALSADATYPAGHSYLSIGASKIEIPYTEISTLIAARVFERLDSNMFHNRPTKEDVHRLMATELEMTEAAIRGALYKDMPSKPIFKDFKYKDIWPSNRPYAMAEQWLAGFQRTVVKNAGSHPDYLEGKLRYFIQKHLQDDKTGPVYLSHFLVSHECDNLFNELRGFRSYCSDLSAQCAGNSERLKEELRQSFIGGEGSKKKKAEAYIAKLEESLNNEEAWFLNKEITNILDQLIERVDVYYKQILKPLSDTLVALPPLFKANVNYIYIHEQAGDFADYLILPSAFEGTRKKVFDVAVLKAEKSFLSSMSSNIKKLIGKTIDQVDDVISSGADVAGFISMFISENFSGLLTINMEEIMVSNLKGGQSLDNYICDKTKELIDSSYPMFKKSGGNQVKTADFAVISVPRDCQQILVSVKNYLEKLHLDQKFIVKTSEEKSRFYIVKVEAGFPLYANAFIEDMEKAYEKQIGTEVGMGKHMKYEWVDRLPSPYIRPAWSNVYSCERTKERNDMIQKVFDECVNNQIIIDAPGSEVVLRIADKNLANDLGPSILTAMDLPSKRNQLDQIKSDLWKNGSELSLKTYGTYLLEKEGGKLKNIRENVLRFPTIVSEILTEGEIARTLEQLNMQLQQPTMFAEALVTHMISVNDVTGDAFLMRAENDPFPKQLTAGHRMSKEFQEYQIYVSFCDHLDDGMTVEINTKFDSLRERISENESKRNELVVEVQKEIIPLYQRQYEEAKDKYLSASLGSRERLQKVMEFYKNVSDELMDRILPKNSKTPQIGITKSKTSAMDSASGTNTWDCSCGKKGITSKFCPECGSIRQIKSIASDTWDCPNCGKHGITSKFCPECGCSRPTKPETWICPNCGTRDISSKFCPSCGCKKPEKGLESETWTCPHCGTQGINANFCPECGTKRS